MVMTMMMIHFFSDADADASFSQRVNRHASRASRSLRRTRTDSVKMVKIILFIVSALFSAVAQSQSSDASSRWVRVFVRLVRLREV